MLVSSEVFLKNGKNSYKIQVSLFFWDLQNSQQNKKKGGYLLIKINLVFLLSSPVYFMFKVLGAALELTLQYTTGHYWRLARKTFAASICQLCRQP